MSPKTYNGEESAPAWELQAGLDGRRSKGVSLRRFVMLGSLMWLGGGALI